jgi:hypothetical protein
MKVLAPAKLAITMLSKRKMSLLESEGILIFLLQEAAAQKSELGKVYATNLKTRINQRRQIVLTSLILYLNNKESISLKNPLKKAGEEPASVSLTNSSVNYHYYKFNPNFHGISISMNNAVCFDFDRLHKGG